MDSTCKELWNGLRSAVAAVPLDSLASPSLRVRNDAMREALWRVEQSSCIKSEHGVDALLECVKAATRFECVEDLLWFLVRSLERAALPAALARAVRITPADLRWRAIEILSLESELCVDREDKNRFLSALTTLASETTADDEKAALKHAICLLHSRA